VPGLGGTELPVYTFFEGGFSFEGGFTFEDAQMDQRTPTTLIAKGRDRIPQRGSGLLMVQSAPFSLHASALAYRS
jgi:hypothetical protein